MYEVTDIGTIKGKNCEKCGRKRDCKVINGSKYKLMCNECWEGKCTK